MLPLPSRCMACSRASSRFMCSGADGEGCSALRDQACSYIETWVSWCTDALGSHITGLQLGCASFVALSTRTAPALGLAAMSTDA